MDALKLLEVLRITRCPNCLEPWYSKDEILKELKRVYPDRPVMTLQVQAVRYGWNVNNALKLSKVLIISPFEEGSCFYYECPVCEVMWDETGKEFSDHEASWIRAFARNDEKLWKEGKVLEERL